MLKCAIDATDLAVESPASGLIWVVPDVVEHQLILGDLPTRVRGEQFPDVIADLMHGLPKSLTRDESVLGSRKDPLGALGPRRCDKVVLRLKAVVHGRQGRPCLVCDPAGRRAGKTMTADDPNGSVDQLLPTVSQRSVRH